MVAKIKSFADRFIETTQDQDLYPPIYNISIFTPRLSGNTFNKDYEDRTPTPYITLMKKDQDCVVFVAEIKMRNYCKEVFINYWQDSKTYDKRLQEVKKSLREVDELYVYVSNDFVAKTDLNKLTELAKRTLKANRQVTSIVLSTVHFSEQFCWELLEGLNVNISADHLRQIWSRVSEPVFHSFEKKREIELLGLIRNQKTWPDIVESCQYFLADYNKIDNIDQVSQKLKDEYGQVTVEQADKLLKEINLAEAKKEKAFNEWLGELNETDKKIVNYAQKLIWLRDVRKDGVSKAGTIMYRIAQRFFQDAGLSEDLIWYYSSGEIAQGFEYLKNNIDLLKQRPQGVAMLFMMDSDESDEFEYGTYDETKKKLNDYYNSKQPEFKSANVREIKGQIACSGQARGKVKIIRNPATEDIETGDILVVNGTRPEFVPLMKKAAGIVTDEGGIASHAAIVSRELNVPCIIGTKIATQVLKDGDEVEVDAERGVVTII